MENEKTLTAEEILMHIKIWKEYDKYRTDPIFIVVLNTFESFASQFKPVTVSDEDIEAMVEKERYHDGTLDFSDVVALLKQMRDKLTK